MDFSKEIQNLLNSIDKKLQKDNQEIKLHLESILYKKYLGYWDYVHLDTLLSLQTPITNFADETIFIIYHQITELYFKLCIHEYSQLHDNAEILKKEEFLEKTLRIVRYFEALIKSFEIMYKGMKKEEFLKFRLALTPASGFQSFQYRKIEIHTTDLINLTQKEFRNQLKKSNATIEKQFEYIYWKKGAIDTKTGKKSLALIEFEKKYENDLIKIAQQTVNFNLWQIYKKIFSDDLNNDKAKKIMKQLDININVNWPLVHYKSAITYLKEKKSYIIATGGTNWENYLPPKFQKRIFFPQLWTDEEQYNWGKQWVESILN